MGIYENKTIYDCAIRYAAIGFKTFPCHTLKGNICSCGRSDCGDVAKHPRTKHGFKDASSDTETLKRYFTESDANIAVATGETSGVWVLDVDDLIQLNAIEKQHGPLPKTWSVETGSRKRHLYFRFTDECKTFKNSVKFNGSLDVRATGGYVILPPSLHACGKRYRWLVSPDDCEIAYAPDWLVGIVPKHGDKTHRVERAKTLYERCVLYLSNCPPAISGEGGHNVTYRTLCRIVELFGGELSDDELLDALGSWNERCEPPWSENELRHKLSDARLNVSEYDSDLYKSESDDDTFPILGDDAFCGIVGEIVRAIEPQTESHPAGVLVSLLTALGNVIGNGSYIRIGAERHHANLFVCLVGDTSDGKGMAWSIADYLLKRVASAHDIAYGLSSGEGLIERVADESETVPGPLGKTFCIPPTRRLLCYEDEFSKPITVMRREGNTLSAILRSAWDCRTLESAAIKNKLRASNAFVSLIGGVTPDELKALFAKGTESSNGFANRFLWVCVKRTRSLPFGGNVSVIDRFVEPLKRAVDGAKKLNEVSFGTDAETLWRAVYDDLRASKGSLGAVTGRAATQVLRLALLYAALDCSPIINERHLKAALSVWRYCEDSASVLFGDGTAIGLGSLAERLLKAIRERPGSTKTELRYSNNVPMTAYDDALRSLVSRKLVICVPVSRGETYYPAPDVGVGVQRADNVKTYPHDDAQNAQTPNGYSHVQAETKDVCDNVERLSLTALIEWRNRYAVAWERREDGCIWVTNDYEHLLTPAITLAIHAEQEVLANFVPPPVPVYADVTVTDDGEDWFEELKRSIGDVDDYAFEIDLSNEDDSWMRDLSGPPTSPVPLTCPPFVT